MEIRKPAHNKALQSHSLNATPIACRWAPALRKPESWVRIVLTLTITLCPPSYAEDCITIDRFVKAGVSIDSSRPHPCGWVYSQCLDQIIETKNLFPNWAHELSPQGEVLRAWPMPVDGEIWAVSGDFLYVAFPNSNDQGNEWASPNYIKISPDGHVSTIDKISRPEVDISECSELTDVPNLQNAFCGNYLELGTNKNRIISFEPVCS